MWEFWFHTNLFLTEKSWFFFIFIFDDKANAIPTLFGTIFTITIKFVHLMIDLFLRFDPLSFLVERLIF